MKIVRFTAVFIILALGAAAASTPTPTAAQHPIEQDTDGDGLPDGWEEEYWLDPNDPNDADLDYNNNGLTNIEEYKKRYDPRDKDTDGDGLSNYAESTGLFGFFTDPLEEDTDEDGLDDLEEMVNRGCRRSGCECVDTGNRTQIDEIYPDKSDRNWARDQVRKLRQKYPYELDPLNRDVDRDGLEDGDEISHKTSPNVADSDLDGLSDGDEVHNYKTDPKERDTDEDGLTDYEEVFGVFGFFTNPKDKDTDNDGIYDGEEVLGFGYAPISPSEHILTYEEFTSGDAYSGEYVTLKASVEKIKKEGAGLKEYWLMLEPLNEKLGCSGTSSGSGARAVATVRSRYHYEVQHDFALVDDRFDLTLKEGDTVVVVGEAQRLKGSTRELVVDGKGKIYLLLSPGEASTRWLPSTKYVKAKVSLPLPTATPTATLKPSPPPSSSTTPTPAATASPKPRETETKAAEEPGFEAVFGVAGLLAAAVAFLVRWERR
ncbi:MAG: PGF-CTERM sorting domain-containing protein [Methanophagales archaeon]|nr:PGF-CTERM sorting domain-containing protein [Methanophagales archaeon]